MKESLAFMKESLALWSALMVDMKKFFIENADSVLVLKPPKNRKLFLRSKAQLSNLNT